MTLIEQARDGDVLAVDYVCNRLEQAEKVIAELVAALYGAIPEMEDCDCKDTDPWCPKVAASKALASAKAWKEKV